MRYGKRTIISDRYLIQGRQGYYVKAKCECGRIDEVRESKLKHGESNQCVKCSPKTHGHSNEKLYEVWLGIRDRCRNNIKYSKLDTDWGWLSDYAVFREWSIKNGYGEGLSIDRIDNSKGYSEENCRWTDSYVQACNRGFRKGKNTKGVSRKYKKYLARITVNKKTVEIGCFFTEEEAVKAYDNYIHKNNLPHTTNKMLREV